MSERDQPLRARRRRLPINQQHHDYPPLTKHLAASSSQPATALPNLPPKSHPLSQITSKIITSRSISVSAIPGLKEAFEETPIKLRELEEGWRARRRKVLGEITTNAIAVPSRLDHIVRLGDKVIRKDVNTKGQEEGGKIGIYGPQPRRPSIRFVDDAFPPLTPPPTPPPSTSQASSPDPPVPPSTIIRELGKKPVQLSKATPPISLNTPTLPSKSINLKCPLPILVHPLTPTSRPTTLPSSRHSSSPKSTIHILPSSSSVQCIISLPKQTIKLSNEGTTLTFHTPASTLQHSKRIDVSGYKAWTEEDKRDWEMVRGVIEGFKRRTPRVKIYNTLGQLSITCSTPPDIILSFIHPNLDSPPNTHPSGPLSNHLKKPAKPDTRVKVMYSRLTTQLRIDISTADRQAQSRHMGGRGNRGYSNGTGRGEVYRSKRILPIAVHEHEKGIDWLSMGIEEIDTEGWSEVEKEGLRRLWSLKAEWQKFEVAPC